MIRKTALFCLLLAAVIAAGCVAAETEETVPFSRNPAAMEAAAASVVRLEVYNDRDVRIGTGSGFAAIEPGVLVTAAHVIVNMAYMIATKDDGDTFRIDRVFDADVDADIALCALPEDAGLAPLQPGRDDPRRGEPIVAIGSQFGLINLVTMGNVCGRWDTGKVSWILFTAPVSGGSSGGPLLDDDGCVIGIITGTYDKGQNLNLAAPWDAAVRLYGTNSNEGGTSR